MLKQIKEFLGISKKESDTPNTPVKEDRKMIGRAKAFEELKEVITSASEELETYYLSKQKDLEMEQFKKSVGIVSEEDIVSNRKSAEMETFVALKNKYKDNIFLTTGMIQLFRDRMSFKYSLWFDIVGPYGYKYHNNTIIKLKNFIDNFKDNDLCSIYVSFKNYGYHNFWSSYKSLPVQAQSILSTLPIGNTIDKDNITKLSSILYEHLGIKEELFIGEIQFGKLLVLTDSVDPFILLKLTEEIYVLVDHVNELKEKEFSKFI